MSTAELCLPVNDAAGAEAPHVPAEDELLVGRARAGDAAALDLLVETYRPRIYAFALSLLLRPDDAEDVTQETFVRLVRTFGAYDDRGRFRAWLYRIAANLCRDCRRRNRRRCEVPAETASELVAGVDVHAQVAGSAVMAAALLRLPANLREPMTLRLLEDLSPGEIAAVLGRPANLVRVQLWRARAILVRELGDWLD